METALFYGCNTSDVEEQIKEKLKECHTIDWLDLSLSSVHYEDDYLCLQCAHKKIQTKLLVGADGFR